MGHSNHTGLHVHGEDAPYTEGTILRILEQITIFTIILSGIGGLAQRFFNRVVDTVILV
jgi:hypothetical protein